jgi:hypothetical protein
MIVIKCTWRQKWQLTALLNSPTSNGKYVNVKRDHDIYINNLPPNSGKPVIELLMA